MAITDAFEPADITPQFLDKNEESLYAEVMLGQELITFLNSDLGRTLRGMALQDLQSAKDALMQADPDDTSEVRRLQFKGAVAQSFMQYLQEIAVRAENAEQALTTYRN